MSAVRQNVQLLKPFSFFFVILLPGYSKETKIRPSIGVGDGSKFQIIYKGQFWIITKWSNLMFRSFSKLAMIFFLHCNNVIIDLLIYALTVVTVWEVIVSSFIIQSYFLPKIVITSSIPSFCLTSDSIDWLSHIRTSEIEANHVARKFSHKLLAISSSKRKTDVKPTFKNVAVISSVPSRGVFRSLLSIYDRAFLLK